MRYAIVFGFLAILLGTYAIVLGSIAWLLCWPAVSFALVAVTYACNSPRLLGKQPCGRIAWLSLCWGLPYFILTWSVWHLKRRSPEPAYQQVLPSLWVGRRLLTSEVPAEIRCIVDLTSEFIEQRGVRHGRTYRCWPILDGMIPTLDQLDEIAEWIIAQESSVLVHCAVGHGRTGLIAVAVLLRRQTVPDVRTALMQLKAIRPKIHLNPAQRQLAEEYAKRVGPSCV